LLLEEITQCTKSQNRKLCQLTSVIFCCFGCLEPWRWDP